MRVRRGDVVILDAPFVTRPGRKLRPMLVVQNDRNNSRLANTILATITTNVARATESTQVLVDPQSVAGQSSGLFAVSVVSCENLLTVQQAQIRRKIGRLSDEHLRAVDEALRVSLSLGSSGS
jgi:mRNA interferase MazF